MPVKNIEKRREISRRCYLKNKHRNKHKRQAVRLALKHYPIAQKCSIQNCDRIGERHHPDYSKPLDIIWLCKMHHEEEHHKVKMYCSICGERNLARGFCSKHYKRQRKMIDKEYRDRTNELNRLYRKRRKIRESNLPSVLCP